MLQKYQFKPNDSKMKKYLLCLENNSKDFPANNIKKTGLNGYFCEHFVDIIGTRNIINIYKYLIKNYIK